MTTAQAPPAPLAIACPTCLVDAGEQCRTWNGRIRAFHESRRSAAAQAVDGSIGVATPPGHSAGEGRGNE